jgi:hypothetical protein
MDIDMVVITAEATTVEDEMVVAMVEGTEAEETILTINQSTY